MRLSTLLVATSLAVAGAAAPTVYATSEQSQILNDAVTPSALWEAPAAASDRDLFNGPWGARSAPDPRATYTFLRRKKGGVNPGLVVKDPSGRTWHVKQAAQHNKGEEGPVEVVLSRVLSAVGYHQPPVYFLPSFVLADGSGTHVEPGGRFRLDDKSMKPHGKWSWVSNPFVGTRPFNGLLVILLVFNSWDLKDSNNTLYAVHGDDRADQWYVVRDLGGALGESGHLSPTRNNIEKFERQRFITGLANGHVTFSYDGKRSELLRHITVEDVQWASALLAGLDDRQWRDAFRAGGYPTDVAERFIRKIKANILQGQRIADNASRSAQEAR